MATGSFLRGFLLPLHWVCYWSPKIYPFLSEMRKVRLSESGWVSGMFGVAVSSAVTPPYHMSSRSLFLTSTPLSHIPDKCWKSLIQRERNDWRLCVNHWPVDQSASVCKAVLIVVHAMCTQDSDKTLGNCASQICIQATLKMSLNRGGVF